MEPKTLVKLFLNHILVYFITLNNPISRKAILANTFVVIKNNKKINFTLFN